MQVRLMAVHAAVGEEPDERCVTLPIPPSQPSTDHLGLLLHARRLVWTLGRGVTQGIKYLQNSTVYR